MDKRVILSGGWVGDDSGNGSLFTELCGLVTISNGTVEVEGVVISSKFRVRSSELRSKTGSRRKGGQA